MGIDLLFSAAPIPWPRRQSIGRSGGSGRYVDETLNRAILTESASALTSWFGGSLKVLWCWRNSFDVASKFGPEESKRLPEDASER
jgi:hypothetical protein